MSLIGYDSLLDGSQLVAEPTEVEIRAAHRAQNEVYNIGGAILVQKFYGDLMAGRRTLSQDEPNRAQLPLPLPARKA